MRDTALYQLVPPLEDADVALKLEDRPALTDADTADSDQVFAALASEPEALSESSRFVANMQDPFAQEATREQQPVSQEDTDPLTSRWSNNGVASAEHIPSTPLNNSANNNPQNLAGANVGAGQGPGGVSTPNPSGGGSTSGGGSANLHLPSPTQVTPLQEGLSGATSQTAPATPNVGSGSGTGSSGDGAGSNQSSSALLHRGSGSGTGSSGAGPNVRSSPLLLSSSGTGSSGGLTGAGTTFSALEGGLAVGQATGIQAVSPLVQGTAGTALSNVTVATFTEPDPNGTASDFTATIDWGDNTTPTTGTVSALPGGGFSVSGSHLYTLRGTYSVQVTITDVDSGATATSGTTANIADAALTATPATINATEGTPLSNVTVAAFTSANSYAPASSFSATIDWGDGSTLDTGTISGSAGNFIVTGSHTYTEGGTYQVSVTIQSYGLYGVLGSSAAVASNATVTDLPLTGTGVALTPAVTGSDTTLTASFADANSGEDPSNYLAQIDWGDGWIDDAAVSGSNGSYNLSGSHAYDHPGDYTVTVTITDGGGSTLTQTGNVSIAAAAMSASGTTLTATAGQALSNAQIATFTDGNTDEMNDWYGPASGYTTTIDWGDGTALDTSAAVMGDEDGFYVIGNHTYANPGAYTATVTITNTDGVSTSTTSTIDVTTITPTGASFSASEGVAANNVTVATFTDTQPDTYTATIDWGDGSALTSGVVSSSGGSYTVTGSYTYADGGTYPVTVTITNSEGLNAVVAGTANVADAPLTATPQSVTTPANIPLNNAVLATFTDANTNDSSGSYSASIDWGDGSPTDVGTIAFANGVYTVSGSHTYTSQGSFTATVYIGDAGGATTTASATVNVTAPVINATAADLSAQESVPLNNVVVASFTAPGQASDYSASVDWGDGNTSTGTITGSGGSFSVLASNTYEEQTGGQAFAITVTISDAAGDTATAIGSATVDPGTMSSSGDSLQATEGNDSTLTLAPITDTDPGYGGDEFTAVVDWGDGTPQDIATVTGGNGSYSVVDTHTYAEEGSYTATVTITDPNGLTTQTVSAPISVVDAALSPVPYTGILEATQNIAVSGVALVQFTDANTSEMASTFTASIAWRDGATTAGVVTGAGGQYSVSGSHTYADWGSYTATITVTDPGGSQIVVTLPVVVYEAPVVDTVANFSDTNSYPVSSYSATINWGDNTPTSSGTISGGPSQYLVTGSHTYAEEGNYTVIVTISGPDGTISVQSTAQVSDPPIVASQAPPPSPQAPPPAAAVPSIKLDFGSGKMNAIAAAQKQPGFRIHIDDSFLQEVLDPADQTKKTLLSDYLQNSIGPATNTNLRQATLTIGPAKSQGVITWNFPNGVRVWWQPVQGGPWSQVDKTKFYNETGGKTIPIAIQGIALGGGTVSASYSINGQTAKTSFIFTVYTGLNVSGQSGQNSPQQNFLNQLTAATGYQFQVNTNGDIWRTKGDATIPASSSYKETAGEFLSKILNNYPYINYTSETATTQITAVAGNTPGVFDSLVTANFYPDNIATVIKAFGTDGPNFYDLSVTPPKGSFVSLGEDRSLLEAGFSSDSRILAIWKAKTQWFRGFVNLKTTSHEEVALWDVTGTAPKARCALTGPSGQWGPIAFSPDGKILVFGANIWDLPDGKPRFRGVMNGQEVDVQKCLFLPSSRYALTPGFNSNTSRPYIHVRDMRQQVPRILQTVSAAHAYCSYQTMALSPDGKRLAVGENNYLNLWEMKKEKIQILPPSHGHTQDVKAMSFGACGNLLATIARDGTLRLWDLDGSRPHERLVQKQKFGFPWDTIALSPDGTKLAAGYQGGSDGFTLWEISRSGLRVLAEHKKGGRFLSFSPDSKMLFASNGFDSNKVIDLSKPTETAESLALGWRGGQHFLIEAIAVSPDGQTLAVGGSYELELWQWTESGWKKRPNYRAKCNIKSMSFGGRGGTLLIGGGFYKKGEVHLYDMTGETPKPIAAFTGLRDVALSVTASSTGKLFAATDETGRVVVWSASGQKLHEWTFPGPVHCVAFAPDGRHLALGNGDGTVYILRLAVPTEK